MPLWLIIVIVVVVVIALALILPQLPAQNRLIDVCDDEDPSVLRAKLEAGGDPNKPGWFGLTPLGEAVVAKRTENVRLLLKHGADPKGVGKKQSPLHSAVDSDAIEIAEVLLQAGADPNQVGPFGQTAFVCACLAGKASLAKLLLENGGRVDSVDAFGEDLLTAVLVAISTEKKSDKRSPLVETLEMLLQNGANPNARSKKGIPMVAIAMQHVPALKLIVEHGAITDVAWDGQDLKGVIDVLLEAPQDAHNG